MKKIISLLASFVLFVNIAQAQELSIDKQLVGIVGAISGTVKTETRTLKAGDKIYLNETIYAAEGAGTQLLLLDQSTFTIGSDSEVVMDTFIYDPATNDGKIVASVKQGSLKVISGLISKKNPDSLTVEVPEGTLGSRGTEFQTIVSKKRTDTLLIGPGKNNTLGLRPGAVLVGNKFGSTIHPLVKKHPVTGNPHLYVNPGFTNQIVGMNSTDSRRLFNYLYDHMNQPKFQIRYKWSKNTIAIWDNRCTMHFALADYYPENRKMHRITIINDSRLKN